MKILLVDDELELVSAMTERLNLRGIDADYATSAAQALEKAAVKEYDLSVLDVKMPGTSGLELWKILKEKYPDMKFIFLTGHTSQEDFETGQSTGFYYLLKPISFDVLL
ncbi:MAG: response regulator, partial [Desulfonatronovibrionaceae bacterium]